jgi:chemotaxis protein CheX
LNKKDISESELRVFITAVTEYFQALAGEPAQVRSAYLGADLTVPQSYDYTGLITISGNYRGCVYFSCRQVLLRRLLVCMGENDHSEANLLDAVGEVANTFRCRARNLGAGNDSRANREYPCGGARAPVCYHH